MAVSLRTNVNEYVGLSTDDKPTVGVPVGSRFFEVSPYALYIFDGTDWYVQP